MGENLAQRKEIRVQKRFETLMYFFFFFCPKIFQNKKSNFFDFIAARKGGFCQSFLWLRYEKSRDICNVFFSRCVNPQRAKDVTVTCSPTPVSSFFSLFLFPSVLRGF